MPPKRHDIFLLRWRLGKSFDHRPCIVLESAKKADFVVVLVSSSDLHRQGYDFEIPVDHPDFKATGLKKTSFALGDEIHEVPISMLNTQLGQLVGTLASDFDQWID